MKKRIISLFLTVLTVLSLAAPAMAADISAPMAEATAVRVSVDTPITAADLNGWVDQGSYRYYYVNGVMQKGFLTVHGRTYYVNLNDGHMMKNGWITVAGERYYLHKDGHVMKGGWLTVRGKRYYIDQADGHMLKDCWVAVKGKNYRLAENGHMLKNGWVTVAGERYYLHKDGHMMSGGWITYRSKKYYLYKDGTMARNTYVGGYYVGSDGARIAQSSSGSGSQGSSSGYNSNTTVYVSRGGIIHTRSDCSGMKYSTKMALGTAEGNGYKRCNKCF